MRLSEHEPTVHPQAELADVRFGRWCEVGQGTRLSNVVMGDYSYVERFGDIANARIGKFANIAAMVRMGPTDHPMTGASMHHFQYRSNDYWDDVGRDTDFFARRHARLLVVGHDTWFGHGCIIKPGLTVGDGAIVGAGAVVTRDVTPYSIVAGNPARVIRMRFAPDIIDRLRALAWWDWDHDRLRAALPDFRSLDAAQFLDRYS